MEQRIEYIERFFTGNMSDKERSDFEKLRSEDQSFNNEVILWLKAREVIRLHARMRMKQRFDSIGRHQAATDVNKTGGHRIMERTWLSIAASVLVIGSLAYFALSGILSQNRTESYLSIYDNYFEKPGIEQVITRSSAENDLAVLWYAALEKYVSEDYKGAVSNFRMLLDTDEFEQPSAANFYAGLSYMNLDMPDSAVIFLSHVSPSSSFTYDATWYTALCYIKTGDAKNSGALLEKIKQTENHPRQKDASRLLRDLTRLEKKELR